MKRKHEIERRSMILKSGHYTDVVFCCPSDENESGFETVEAHKIIFISASDVFEKMFYGSLPENTVNEGGKTKIEVLEINISVFKVFLK